MLTRIGWVAALSLLLGIGLSSQAQAKTFEQQIAGAVEATARDFLQDGFFRLSGLLAAKGGPGSAQVRVLVESGPPVAPTGVCPSDGFYLQQPVEVAGFIATFNDLSLLSGARGAPGVACVDFVTGNTTIVAEGRITGGNGRFDGYLAGHRRSGACPFSDRFPAGWDRLARDRNDCLRPRLSQRLRRPVDERI